MGNRKAPYLLNDGVHIDRFGSLDELVTSVEVDVLPGEWRYLLHQADNICVAGQQSGIKETLAVLGAKFLMDE